MKYKINILILCLMLPSLCFAELYMDMKRDALSLNGEWQCLLDHVNEKVFDTAISQQLSGWKSTQVPGPVLDNENQSKSRFIKCVWAKRQFQLSPKTLEKDVVLKWNGIRFGATIWLNGKLLNQYEPIGPNTVLVPTGFLQTGVNEILIKAKGWAGLEKGTLKAKDGKDPGNPFPVIPTGGGTQGWGAKSCAIYDDIWLEFYQKVYMKWILAIPQPEENQVTFRIWFTGKSNLPDSLDVFVSVLSDKNAVTGKIIKSVSINGEFKDISVPVDNIYLWSPENPRLYSAKIKIQSDNIICDNVEFNFGMRSIKVVNGNYEINNKRVYFHGSNLVNEWNWGRDNPFNRETKRYIVDEARNMNLNSFRTHTLPPPTRWLDTCDKYGTMILSEFPILYNYGLPFFASDQWDTFHKNALNDVTGWVTKLWNHPAIMIWVLTNESGTDEFWEMTTLRDHVLSLDPTRPTLRSGEVTKESHDIHTCFNSYTDTEGWLQITIDKVLRNTAPEQTISNSEYMNLFGTRESSKQRWLGDPESEDEKLLYAEFAMEHTEAMRRYDFDLILPYMYAGWPRFRGNNWRRDFPTPMAAALHSSMSPVLASLDLFNRNFKTGQRVDTPLYLINDLHENIEATVKIYLTRDNPLFVPDSNALSNALWIRVFEHTFKADCKEIKYINWQVPEQSGKYYISTVVFVPGKRPVTSQRIVRAVEQQRNKNNNKNLCLLGADKQARDWLALHHLNYFEANRDNIKKADIFLIWNAIVIKDNTKTLTRDILEQIQSGSKLVILEQEKWDWKELVDYDVEFFSRSRAFAYKEALNNNILTNTKKEMFMRWNGLPGTVTEQEIKGHLLEKGHKIMWAESPEHCYLLQVPYGRGEMIISQLDMKAHLLYGERDYDPVAEQVMFNLLGLF